MRSTLVFWLQGNKLPNKAVTNPLLSLSLVYLKATFLFKNKKWTAGRHFVRQIIFLRDHGLLRASPEQLFTKKTYKITQSLIFEVTISVDSVYNYQTGVISTVSFSGTRKKPGKWTSYNNQAAVFLGVSPTILG